MDIFEIINSAKKHSSYNNINPEGYMIPLGSRDYDFVYKELKYKNTFHYIDKNSNLNFLIKIQMGKDIEKIVKNKKMMDIIPDKDGVVIQLKIVDIDKNYQFAFNFSDSKHLYNLKKLIDSGKVYINFIVYDEKSCMKDFTVLFRFEDIIMGRLKYMIELAYNGEHPRIEYEKLGFGETKYISIGYDINILEEIMSIIDNLKKWGANDNFDILVNSEKEFKIIIDGRCSNYNYIKSEIAKKHEILGEGNCEAKGKSFLRFSYGMLYFFKNSTSSI